MASFVIAVMACLLVCSKLVHSDAQDGYCFRIRNPIGERGRCQQIMGTEGPQPISSAEECCRHGGMGWAPRSNGKRCEDACRDQSAETGDLVQVAEMGVGGDEAGASAEIVKEGENIDDPQRVEGVWTAWSAWQSCSVTCGSGVKHRRRECSPPSSHASHCPGDRVEQTGCYIKQKCPVHGGWGIWTRWSECSATCGETMDRHRDCDSPRPEFGGNECEGEHREVEWCNNVQHCPIDGGWKEWSAWSQCSSTCSSGSKRRRYRTCTKPEPRHGGQNCQGDANEVQTCKSNGRRCPVDGGLTEWGNWRCPPGCANGGEGVALRQRRCANPAPKYGGRQCRDPLTDTRQCSETECPVDGMWGDWGPWKECSSTCGERSFHTRKRVCDNPTPQVGGMPCIGDNYEKESCNLDPCPQNIKSYGSSGIEDSQLPPCDDVDDEDGYSGDSAGGSGCRDNGSGESDASSEESKDSSSYFESPDYAN